MRYWWSRACYWFSIYQFFFVIKKCVWLKIIWLNLTYMMFQYVLLSLTCQLWPFSWSIFNHKLIAPTIKLHIILCTTTKIRKTDPQHRIWISVSFKEMSCLINIIDIQGVNQILCFFEDFNIFSGLCFLSMSECVHTPGR